MSKSYPLFIRMVAVSKVKRCIGNRIRDALLTILGTFDAS